MRVWSWAGFRVHLPIKNILRWIFTQTDATENVESKPAENAVWWSLLSDTFRYRVFSHTGLHPSAPTDEAAVLPRHESHHTLFNSVSINTTHRIVRGSSQHSHPSKQSCHGVRISPSSLRKNTHKRDKSSSASQQTHPRTQTIG